VLVASGDQVTAVAAFTTANGRVTSLNIVADPEQLRHVRI
jgi:hypothetical protein